MPLVTKKSFIAKFRSHSIRYGKKLQKYCNNTNEKNIHDIRTSTRRLDVSFTLLNKKIQSKPEIRNYFKLSKLLFRYNSQIRDIDIICRHLKLYQNKESYRLQDYQKQKRGKKLKSAMDLALKLRNLKLPEIDEKYISTKKIRSKFENEKKRLLDRIVKDIPNVISDPKSIEELHELRKSSKKLRYLLELLPKEEKAVSRLIKMQDKLGSIHDFDITITFLNRCKQNSIVQSLIRGEAHQRDNKFQEFSENMREFRNRNYKFNLFN